jgi:hypothetical protein
MSDQQTLEIRWPWCHVPTINGETPLVNLSNIGGILPGKVQAQGGGGHLVVGAREIAILVVGAAQLPVEVAVGEALREAVLARAEPAIEVTLGDAPADEERPQALA